jgi:hypothetical protein
MEYVTRRQVNYHAIVAKGGEQCRYGNFAFIRCPSCGTVYLVDYEVDDLYIDPTNLAHRISFVSVGDLVPCQRCPYQLLADDLWSVQKPGYEAWLVPWDVMRASPWAWAVYDPAADTQTGLVGYAAP